jgi:hypothetical protein
MALRYEDLLEDPWKIMQEVWLFLGASPLNTELKDHLTGEVNQNPDAEWQVQKAGDIAQALQKGKYGNWRTMFTPQDKITFENIAAGTLKAWGYPVEGGGS